MGSANTFGTFLQTLRKLESSPDSSGGEQQEKNWLHIARLLQNFPDGLPVDKARMQTSISPDAFFGALLSGRDKGLFVIDEKPDEPVVMLSKLGMSLARY